MNLIEFETVTYEDADAEKPGTPQYRVREVKELRAMDIPPPEWILKPVIPVKGAGMAYAPRGIGKTYLMNTAAYAIASGCQIFSWEVPKPRRVLVVDGEMPMGVLIERFNQIARGFEREPADGFLRILAADDQEFGLPDLCTKEGTDVIDAKLDGVDLVILDNISTLCRSGKENDAESWTSVQEWILKLRRRSISILIVHHAGKGGAQRGTSRREDILDTVIALRRPSDYLPDQGARFEVHFEKSRGAYGEDVKAFEAKLEVREGAATWTTRPIEDLQKERVRELLGDKGLTVRDIAEETGISKSKVGRLKKAIKAEPPGL